MNKKKKVMSLSIEPDLHDTLKEHANRKTDGNVSKLICDMLEKYPFSDDVIPVILKVPVLIKENKDELKKWLDIKSAAIFRALTS